MSLLYRVSAPRLIGFLGVRLILCFEPADAKTLCMITIIEQRREEKESIVTRLLTSINGGTQNRDPDWLFLAQSLHLRRIKLLPALPQQRFVGSVVKLKHPLTARMPGVTIMPGN